MKLVSVVPTKTDKPNIFSKLAIGSTKRTIATIVNPPFVLTFKFCGPPFMNTRGVLVKLICPFPVGPPRRSYVGKDVYTRFSRRIFATVENELRGNFSAMNLAQVVFEITEITLPPVCPAGQIFIDCCCAVALASIISIMSTRKCRRMYWISVRFIYELKDFFYLCQHCLYITKADVRG